MSFCVQAFLDKLHDGGQQWVPIIDPGILIDPGYPAYDEGTKEDIWIKDATGQPYAGQVILARVMRSQLQLYVSFFSAGMTVSAAKQVPGTIVPHETVHRPMAQFQRPCLQQADVRPGLIF